MPTSNKFFTFSAPCVHVSLDCFLCCLFDPLHTLSNFPSGLSAFLSPRRGGRLVKSWPSCMRRESGIPLCDSVKSEAKHRDVREALKELLSDSFRHKTNMQKDKSLDAQQGCFLVFKTYLWEPKHYSSVSSWDTSGSFVPKSQSF